MSTPGPGERPVRRGAPRLYSAAQMASRAAAFGSRRLTVRFGGPVRTRVIVTLACVLALASADAATVGASATALRSSLHIDNTDVGLLVAVNSLVGAVAALPFGLLADRVSRTWTVTVSIVLWGLSMVLSATAGSFGTLLLWRLGLGVVTAAAGPPVASLVGDYFPSSERGVIYSYILSGELLGAGVGFTITGDISSLSWRASFVILGLAAFPLAWVASRLPEPARGGANPIVAEVAPSPRSGPDDRVAPSEPQWSGYQWAAPPPPPPGDSRAGGTDEDIDREYEAAREVVPDDSPDVTDAQRLAAAHGIEPDYELVDQVRDRNMGILTAIRYVLSLRTNVALIISSACGYYFLAGVSTFGVEFVKGRYHVGTPLANLLMIAIGGGAVLGVVISGPISDAWLHRGRMEARILVPALGASATVILFVPALLTHSVVTALPYVIIAAFALSAQNPPIDAARLDIMPSFLWGRAEGLRTFLRTMAQALAPLLFGALSDVIGLRNTFLVMLLPLAASAYFLFRATRTYPRDVATAAESSAPSRRRG